jgi:hemerythrin HHE cation binding domain-containing protein
MDTQGLYATELLRHEHRRVCELFARYESPDTDAAEQSRLLGQIAMALSVHLRVEEEVLHPAAREVLDEHGRELLDEAAVENVPQKYFLIELITSPQADRLFRARVKVIRRHFEHHVREEECRLLPLLENSGIDQAALGLQIATCRAALLAAASGPAEESLDDL